ncbi:MAG: rhomboid family intramembrane serine protease, partial [Gammaproteobacteria bacterium]|nr:rhomboid family intramembrane serine protease [Gammaproteobacteria bacterium]
KLSPPVYFSIWLAINIFGVLSGEQGIDYWAHLGGFIAGLVIGLALRKSVMEANPIVAMLGSKSVKVS